MMAGDDEVTSHRILYVPRVGVGMETVGVGERGREEGGGGEEGEGGEEGGGGEGVYLVSPQRPQGIHLVMLPWELDLVLLPLVI
jgi:hypothetical protein